LFVFLDGFNRDANELLTKPEAAQFPLPDDIADVPLGTMPAVGYVLRREYAAHPASLTALAALVMVRWRKVMGMGPGWGRA
jgi:hypothetical protein